MTADQIAELAERYKKSFGDGMLPFDSAYSEAMRAGEVIVEAQKRGAHALLDAFVSAVKLYEAMPDPVEVVTCPTCGGDGGDLDDSSKPCDECDGSGRIRRKARA